MIAVPSETQRIWKSYEVGDLVAAYSPSYGKHESSSWGKVCVYVITSKETCVEIDSEGYACSNWKGLPNPHPRLTHAFQPRRTHSETVLWRSFLLMKDFGKYPVLPVKSGIRCVPFLVHSENGGHFVEWAEDVPSLLDRMSQDIREKGRTSIYCFSRIVKYLPILQLSDLEK
jgi:hypothetical protein